MRPFVGFFPGRSRKSGARAITSVGSCWSLALEHDRRRRGAALTVLVLSLVFPATAKAAFPGANGKIAYTAVDEIWSANPDGSGQALLATPPHPGGSTFYFNANPAWSANGQKIAFQQDRFAGSTQGTDVIVANPDGSGQTNITNAAQLGQVNADPSWSPDGSKIAVAVGASCSRIYSMNSNGTGKVQLTTAGCDTQPSWSPDGTKIAFTSTRDGNEEVYVMSADGTSQLRLTNNAQPDSHPNWSPDGTKIAFTRRSYDTARQMFERNIWVMTAGGAAPTQLNTVEDSQAPAWAPDGTKISFDTAPSTSPTRIWTMNSNGSSETSIADGSQPDWQPIAVDYERPASASPIHVSIVPAFRQCATGANPANGAHSPPLSGGACLPPGPSSTVARVGPGSTSSADLTVIPGDVQINATLTDIQTTGGADYNPNASGADLTLAERIRITDSANGAPGYTSAGTVTEIDFRLPVDCTTTAGPEGANCSTATTANTFMPGMIQAGKAMIVQVFRIRVDDSGANGIRGDSDDRFFAQQGIYIP